MGFGIQTRLVLMLQLFRCCAFRRPMWLEDIQNKRRNSYGFAVTGIDKTQCHASGCEYLRFPNAPDLILCLETERGQGRKIDGDFQKIVVKDGFGVSNRSVYYRHKYPVLFHLFVAQSKRTKGFGSGNLEVIQVVCVVDYTHGITFPVAHSVLMYECDHVG